MDLFENCIDKTKNWLPKDGTVNYYGKLFNRQQADNYLGKLLNTIEWRNDEAIIYGKFKVKKAAVSVLREQVIVSHAGHDGAIKPITSPTPKSKF